MKLGDIEDCESCPLNGNKCGSRMTAGPGGMPIEPPCVDWDTEMEIDDFEDELESREYAMQEYYLRTLGR